MKSEILSLLTVLSFIVVFGLLYVQLHRSTKPMKMWYFVFVVISAGPLVYMLYEEYTHNYLDANIGLGLAHFYTWFMTVIAAVLALASYLRNQTKAD